MITINAITNDEKNYFKGKIGKEQYSVEASPEAKKFLTDAQASLAACETFEEVQVILVNTLAAIERLRVSEDSQLETILANDLFLNKKTGKYHVKLGDNTSKKAVHQFFVDKMIEANDKGLDPKPWLIFWVRLMRNPLFKKDDAKVENLVAYMKKQHLDSKKRQELKDEGYSDDVASFKATFDQVSITEEGILATFKYVRLRNKKFVVEKDEKTGEQTVVEKDKYERKLVVNEDTGEVISDELDLPKAAEELKFAPPVMGDSGDAFTCRALDDIQDKSVGHVVQVGKVHELLEGFNAVNCNDSQGGVKGLHTGGYMYVQGFGGKTDYLIDCLIAPEDIGAVCDVSRSQEGAVRSKRFMATGAHFQVSSGMYHPSAYAKFLDGEWDTAKAEMIEKAKEKIKKVDELL
jgi:hypothetical protein